MKYNISKLLDRLIVGLLFLLTSATLASAAAPSTGGPDQFGYTYADNRSPQGPTYEWIEISGTGTQPMAVYNSDDYVARNIPLGFFFNYYGTDYSSVHIGNNGIVFSSDSSGQYVNEPIGQTSGIHGFLAPYWDDIVTWYGGAIYYQMLGVAPNRIFVVEWLNNQHYSSSPKGITFEAVMYEGSNDILFQYKDLDFGISDYNNGGSATVGIEGPTGNIGLQYSYNQPVLDPGLAIRFKYPQYQGVNLFLSSQAPPSKDRGTEMTLQIYYHSFGDADAQNVVLQNTLPNGVDFVSASSGGVYDAGSRTVTWSLGTLRSRTQGAQEVVVSIATDAAIGTTITSSSRIQTTDLEVRYDDNQARTETRVTGSSLPVGISVGPNNGGTTPSVYWGTPITFSYTAPPSVLGVDIRIHINDGGPDITGPMAGGLPEWTFTTTFHPRHGQATVMYTIHEPTPYSIGFDLRSMRGFENSVTAQEITDYIRQNSPNSPMLTEPNIGQRFIDAGREHHVNPAFLVATPQHESGFGTLGWAATHPLAHNAMGYGIPSGSTPPDNINSAGGWGDMVESVANAIENGCCYYTQGRYTVDVIRNRYAGDPQSDAIVQYMNDLARFGGQAGDYDEDFNIYIDPAGYIYDQSTGTRIAGAIVWLQRLDEMGVWQNVPTGQTPAISQPDANPLITGLDGQYQWDVLTGSYRVHVEAPGYYPADSIVVSIPPAVTDLHVGLIRMPDLRSVSYPLVSYRRITRTLWEYTYRFNIKNVGIGNATAVSATLQHIPAQVTVVDGSVSFPAVPAGGTTISSSDTFTIRIDRSAPVQNTDLTWRLSFTDAAGTARTMVNYPLY